MNDGVGDGRGVRDTETTMHHILTEYLMMGTAHVFATQKQCRMEVSETFDSLENGRNCILAMNYHC